MFRTRILAFFLAVALSIARADAVIIFGNDPDLTANKIAPDNAFPHDGWDYEGDYGFFLGTAIGPHFFISAKHVSAGTGSILNFQGIAYQVTKEYRDPVSDLDIFEVAGTFPIFAPLYDKQDEPGKRIVDIGRGTDRGGPIYFNNDPLQLRGWSHGTDAHTQRWGENVITNTFSFSREWDLMMVDFDGTGLPSECHLSGGDSGGAAFINDGGVWKLAGINYAIDSGFYMQANLTTGFSGAIFDLRGYYYRSGGAFVQINSSAPVPSSFYPTRISTKMSWIQSVIDPAGDYDGDGIKNLLQYALRINSSTSSAWTVPLFSVRGGNATLRYRKLSETPQLVYQLEQSTNLVAWSVSTPQETVIATDENIQTVDATVAGGTGLFLRLRITQQ